MIFIIVSLKTETCSLATRLLSEDSQSNRLMAFLYDRNFPEKNTTQLFHKEEGKQPLNRILHKFFDDENYNVTKKELESPLSYQVVM